MKFLQAYLNLDKFGSAWLKTLTLVIAVVLFFSPVFSTSFAQTLDQSPPISFDPPAAVPQVLTLEPGSQDTLTSPPAPIIGSEGTTADPVIATIEQEQIRLSDLRFPPGQVPSGRELADALNREIQARVAYLEALRLGVDLNPNIVLELARTRRSIISVAFLENEAARLSKPPSDEDISAFIASRPDFFSGRRVYRFTEVRVGVSEPEDIARVVSHVNSYGPALRVQYQNADAFVGWLKAQGFSFLGRVTLSRGSEELDAQLYDLLKTMGEVGYTVIPSENKLQARVVFLHSDVPEPVSAEAYRDNVKLGLFAKARTNALETFLNELMSKASVRIDDEKLAAAVEDLSRITAVPVTAQMPTETTAGTTPRLRVKVFWLLFVTLVSSFLAIRMVVLAHQLWSTDDLSARRLALGLPLLIAGLLTASGWSFFLFEGQGNLQKLSDLAVLPSVVGGLVGGILVIGLSFLLSITDRPYFKCGLLLGGLSLCHVALLIGAMMGW